MERIGVKELRQHASRYLARVKAGESVEVTERGELIAMLVPPTPASTARDKLVASGRLRPATRSRQLPARVASNGPTTEQVLDQLRAEDE